MTALAAAVVAIVVHDGAILRAAPSKTAPRQAILWKGDTLEVRGESHGWVHVWDSVHDRPGYMKAWLVRQYSLDAASAPALRVLVTFFRDMPGAESLGIGYVALYLKTAPPEAIDAAIFDDLGRMARRLAERASGDRTRGVRDRALPHHLEVAARYGVTLTAYASGDGDADSDGAPPTRLCYDGDAFRRVLAMKATAAETARAALALTDPRCAPPGLAPVARTKLVGRWAGILAKPDPAAVVPELGNRLRMRLARVQAERAFLLARAGDLDGAADASRTALASLLRVDEAALDARERVAYRAVAVRVEAARWARDPSAAAARRAGHLRVAITHRKGGRSCIAVTERGAAKPAVSKCTYGLVWPSSVRILPHGHGAVVAVQPLAAWVELWVFRRAAGGWRVDPLVPAATDPDAGYVELAGVTPAGDRLLVAREAVVAGRARRLFQVLRTGTLGVVLQAHTLGRFPSFRRHESRVWRATTLALR